MEVEIIGAGTMIALVWLIAWSMAGESESERRRTSTPGSHSFETASGEGRVRHAA